MDTPPLKAPIDLGQLRLFLAEDMPQGDITTESLADADRQASGYLLAKEQQVLAGLEVFQAVIRLLDPAARFEISASDGDEVEPQRIPLRVEATARALLGGERTALNMMQRLGGIATLTRRFVRAVEDTKVRILDTRKTIPGLRALDKYAVRAGGAHNHRLDLSHAVMVKENHIRMAGGIGPAMIAVEAQRGRAAWIEVEVTNLEELKEALSHAPDVILLDNMTPHQAARAVQVIRQHDPQHKILAEASGNVTLKNVHSYAEAGVDWISIGALTHSAVAVDLSFLIDTGTGPASSATSARMAS
jgi:nicotinate-nucleotide pyrophosphorylase (carboxylating)